jgi:hypothetical protein
MAGAFTLASISRADGKVFFTYTEFLFASDSWRLD